MRILKCTFFMSIPTMLIGFFLADIFNLRELGLNIFKAGGLVLAVVVFLFFIFSIFLTPRSYWED